MIILDKILNKQVLKDIRVSDSSIYHYDFMMNLPEKKYKKYIENIYIIRMKKKLNLRKPITLSEKIQWLKLYDNKPIKTLLTDKVLVRNWIEEKIGKEYLKPILGIYKSFNEINFDKLPERFVVKCNHGCKWQFIILDKKKLLNKSEYFRLVEENINGWMSQNFFGWSDFETQYKDITPQIIIEELLRNEKTENIREFSIYCFNSEPKICRETKGIKTETYCHFDENGTVIPIKLKNFNYQESTPVENMKKAFELSRILSKSFKFVRVDWYLYKEKLYFNEMTFTPFSGFLPFVDRDLDIKYGNILNLKGDGINGQRY